MPTRAFIENYGVSVSTLSPVHIGNLVTVAAEVTWTGHTSIETRVVVSAENILTGKVTHTNTAFFVYVALDENGRPTAVPPLICGTEDGIRRCREAEERRTKRLHRSHKDI